MRFSCPFCYYAMNVDDSARGYRTTCNSCGKSILVPLDQFDDGCIIGDFIINTRIGKGSIGTVYKATQISLDRQVALKILSPDYITTKGKRDFLREARAAAKLSHTNLVQSLAVGEDDGIYYMAMTYINGETLSARLKREKRIHVDEALHIAQQVGEALYYAWDEARLIHRDVKPDNIMLTEDGIVKLTDLGLAMNQADWREEMDISGSPAYMSPEQFEGGKLDTRSDIYSLGITLYQMLSGNLPFVADTVKEIARLHFETIPQPLDKLDRSIPTRVVRLVDKMIAKYQEERFNDMEELLNEIWRVRQKTAPNKSLVPDVHTISIKRLDYDIQHESMVAKRQVKKIEERIKSQYDYMKLVLLVVPGLLILAILLIFMLMNNNNSVPRDWKHYYDKATAYERFAGDRGIAPELLIEEGEKLLDEMPAPQTPSQIYYTEKVKSILKSLNAKMMGLELEAAKTNMENLATELSSLKSESIKLQEQITKLLPENNPGENDLQTKNSEFERTLESLENEIKKLNDILENKNVELAKAEEEREKIIDAFSPVKMNLLRAKMQELRGQFRFNDIAVMLAVESVKSPELIEWLKECESANSRYGRIYNALTDSGTKYGSAVFGNTLKVVMIAGGYIDYQENGKIRQKNWKDLPVDNLWDILKSDPLGFGNENEVKSILELLKGNIGGALKYTPENKELNEILMMNYRNTLQDIRYALPGDRKRAESMAQILLKQIDGSPNHENLRLEIRQLFKKDNQ